VRAAAATAARCGLPIVRPLLLADPGDARGWTIADAYGYGPSLWVAPVLDAGAREREVPLPRGTWIDAATGQRLRGGGNVRAAAPLHQIPVYVRAGSIVVTYPEDEIADGLGDQRDDERPLEATLWGRPPGGRTGLRLADGTRIRWREGEWSVSRRREVRYAER
jgi:alpha-glucosidase (family GH31 glycosyl hydrolase)